MAYLLPPPPRYIQVEKSVQISPHLQRIYFSSENFSDFPAELGAHIKLFFPEQAALKPVLPQRDAQGKVTWPLGKKPITRTYTIRDFLTEKQWLVVDFVRHEAFGIAAHWASQAQVGQFLGLAGPGGQARFQADADYFVFMVDLSGLAMLAASLECLPAHALGQVWIEIDNDADQIPLNAPQGIQIKWRTEHQQLEQEIDQQLEQLNWDTEQISVTIAGENARVVALRQLLKRKYAVPKASLYAVPYWKNGQDEEHYHQERHRVMDET
jgi:NADPH-dependent ferric siderophore reductase